MSTLPLRVPHVPDLGKPFARIVAFVDAVFDVLAEARTQAIAAHARYPFAEW